MLTITQKRLKEVVSYNPETGDFTWVYTNSRRAVAGKKAGSQGKYIQIQIDGTRYFAHRLAWLYVHGAMPQAFIDHINGDRHDNRIANLRQCTNKENMQNSASRKGSSSDFLGVSYCKSTRSWRATIRSNGKKLSLGRFPSEQQAYAAYCAAKAKHHAFQPIPREEISHVQ